MPSSFQLCFLISLFVLLTTSLAIVPTSQTFKYINRGPFGDNPAEYFADYRVLPIGNFPFSLCFYNSTPNTFILGLSMGHHKSPSSILRWVWDANRGKPVGEKATLTFGPNGNLVLADVDGEVTWQTGTANKDVIGLKVLPNGNLVLYDGKGKFVWQSFNHPTDTLLVGQAFRESGPNKLVSRLSIETASNGPYSYVMEKAYLAMYFQPNKAKKPLLYYKNDDFGDRLGSLSSLVLTWAPELDDDYAYKIKFDYNMTFSFGTYVLSIPKFNSTYSMLRVDIDGNLRIYTYAEYFECLAWEVTYKLFDRDVDFRESECKLPRRCGLLGVCEDNQCVACPTPLGLLGWSKDCARPVLPRCTGGGNVDFYKVEGVEHFISAYREGNGPMKVMDCRKKCSKDCGCLAFFYKKETSKCLLVSDLGTLVKVSNSTHVGYIKKSK